MESRSVRENICRSITGIVRVVIGLACLAAASAQAVTITVKGPGPTEFVSGFRYTIQEDPTFEVVPDVTGLSGNPDTDPTLALAFHRSHAKIVKVGHAAGSSLEFTRLMRASAISCR